MSLLELDNLVRIGQLVEETMVAEMCALVQSLIADVETAIAQ